MEITRVTMAVEIDNHPYFVVLPQDRMMILVDLAKSLSDSGKLPVMKAPEGYKFETLKKEI